jgi:hypothetical protein
MCVSVLTAAALLCAGCGDLVEWAAPVIALSALPAVVAGFALLGRLDEGRAHHYGAGVGLYALAATPFVARAGMALILARPHAGRLR